MSDNRISEYQHNQEDKEQMLAEISKAYSRNDGLYDEAHAVNNQIIKKKPKKKRKIHKILLSIFLLLVAAAIILGIGIIIKFKPIIDEYDDMAYQTVISSTKETFKMGGTSYIYDSNGNLLTKLKGTMETVYLPYDEIPEDAVNAFVAIEDKSFWTNNGYDLKGIARVCVNYLLSRGDEMHGASTITQQLARNVFLTHEVSLERKVKELLISRYMTKKYSKQDIMEFYINDIYFANGYYGLEAASLGYFNKKSSELSLSEIAYLCAIPNSPSYYDPLENSDNAIERRNLILKAMLDDGYIDNTQYSTAIAEKIVLNPRSSNYNDYAATYAIDCAIKVIMSDDGFEFAYNFNTDDDMSSYEERYNEAYQLAAQRLYAGDYRIYTSINIKAQNTLQSAIDEQLSFDEEKKEDEVYALQGAATVIDNETGNVIAIVGGRSQDELSQYSLNRAFQSYRQPGSTIKPIIVYTPALQQDYTASTKIKNISISSADNAGYGYDLNNLSGSKYTLRKAVEQSKNGCAYLTFYNIGVDYGLSFLEEMQFTKISEKDHSLAASLGGMTYGTTTTEMAGAYATLANYGEFRDVTCIISMIGPDGRELYQDYSKSVYEETASKEMIDILRGVITDGTGKAMNWDSDMDAIGKTGTTDDNKDGWFCGSTPYYTIAVWVGYDMPRELDSLVGGSYPAYIWKDVMEEYITDKPVKSFDTEELEIENHEDESEYDDEEYMPGHSDDEVLSDGYTVGDYRRDSELTQKVVDVINSMHALDKNSKTYESDLTTLYNQGLQHIGSMYGIRMTEEAQTLLDEAYDELKGKGTYEEYSNKHSESHEESHEETEETEDIPDNDNSSVEVVVPDTTPVDSSENESDSSYSETYEVVVDPPYVTVH